MIARQQGIAAATFLALGLALAPASPAGRTAPAALGLGGCGVSRCGRQCPADPEPTERQRQTCEDGVAPAPACQAEYGALGTCSTGLTVCGKDDRTDPAGTAQVVLKECGPQLRAYTDCASARAK